MKLNQIYLGDCNKILPTFKKESVGLVITDPPFGINFKKKKANYNRKEDNVIGGYEDIALENYDEFTFNWISRCKDLLVPTGSMYIISGYNNLDSILNNIRKVGLHLQNHIIWKFQFGVVTRNKFVTSHYHILFVTKEKTGYTFNPNCRFSDTDKTETKGSARYKDMEDVWNIKREYWTGEKKTPTKLPAELIVKILEYSSNRKDVVLDPFLGSGQVAFVAKKLDRQFLGIEIVKEYYEFAKERLNL